MNDQLIINKENDHEKLMKEIKKMSYIKILNLLCSVVRFFLMFFSLSLFIFFPASYNLTFLGLIFSIYLILILPIITIYFLIVLITGAINRDFWIKKKPLNIGCYTICCCCCIMSKNVTFLKLLSLICMIINFSWSFYYLFYFIKDFTHTYTVDNGFFKLIPYSEEKVKLRTLINFIDSLLLTSQFYYFTYFQFFLNNVKIYLEFYKRLIIKNKNKEAEFVRNTLPAKIEDYVSFNDGTELQSD